MAANESLEPKKKNNHIRGIIVIVIALILFATNPSITQFKQYIKDDLKAQARTEGAGLLGELIAGPATFLSTTERSEYFLFSIYKINMLGEKHAYIGVINHFIKIN
jgi:hypothetical protein